MRILLVAILAGAGLFACTPEISRPIPIIQGPALPQPVSNNAVAGLRTGQGFHLFSFMGLGGGSAWNNVGSAAWHLPPESQSWHRLPDVPGEQGRLAGTAATVAGDIYVFGGYTVAEDGSERSVENVYRLNTAELAWQERMPIPRPVDDAVSLVYLDRYVYLISGWHDLGNVNLVQVYDTRLDSWVQATPWPGEAVFGHAGGIVGHQLVVCDGVAVRISQTGQRSFEAVDACFRGRIDTGNIRRINWQPIAHHPGPALYRMAAAGRELPRQEIVFAGGSDNPYNYNGLGYDGSVSSASALVFAWLPEENRWHVYGRLSRATMDHRGLLHNAGSFFIVGGMTDRAKPESGKGPELSSALLEFALP